MRHTGKTPPPYTPPPILSPMRSGTGLFSRVYWRPQLTAAAGPGLLSTSLPAAKLSQLQQEPIAEEVQPIAQPKVEPTVQPTVTQPYMQRQQSLLQTQQSLLQTQPSIVESVTQEEAEPQVPPAPETDIQPHINIGTDHQASLPALKSKKLCGMISLSSLMYRVI